MIQIVVKSMMVGLLLSFGSAALAKCDVSLKFQDPKTEVELLKIPLHHQIPTFSLSYLHSVHLTVVEANYEIRDGIIYQVSETFSQPGYGMGATSDDPTILRVSTDNNNQTLILNREIPDFVLRIQAGQNNRIEHPQIVDLSAELGNRSVRLLTENTCGTRASQRGSDQ